MKDTAIKTYDEFVSDTAPYTNFYRRQLNTFRRYDVVKSRFGSLGMVMDICLNECRVLYPSRKIGNQIIFSNRVWIPSYELEHADEKEVQAFMNWYHKSSALEEIV